MSNLGSTFGVSVGRRSSSVFAGRAVLFVAFCAVGAHAQTHSSDGEARSFVLRAGRIVTADAELPWSFEPGIIVVRDGRIEAIGGDITLPPDLPVFDYPDATILPGFVAAATSLAPAHSGDESIAAGFLAIDTFQPHSDFRRELSGGVTTVHLSPGDHRLLSGQGAVVKLGGPADARVLVPQADLTINLGDPAFGPPRDVTYQTPASSDVAIPPAVRQRPDSRMGQFLAIEEALGRVQSAPPLSYGGLHGPALARAWRQNLPLRVGADRAVDLLGALAFLQRHERFGYLVGGKVAGEVADQIKQANVPLVYLLDGLRRSSPNIGTDPDALETDADALRKLDGVKLALAPARNEPLADFRLAAATAQRAGLSQKRTIEAMTRVPAEVLGVAHRVGSLSPGKDADIVVWFGDPLRSSAHVHRVYVNGSLSFEAPSSSALIVRAGTIWVNEEKRIHNGAVLIEDGRIVAAGHTVPHPPFARVIDAGPDAFVTPGLIDAHGHLGLEGDRSAPAPALSLAMAIGADDVTDRRVARAGVTAVILSPYKASGQGSQVSVIKTAGVARDKRIAKATAGVYFDMAAKDALKVESTLRKRWNTGKKYLEKWQKFEKELAEWKEKKAKGEKIEGAGETEEAKETTGEADPITGTWAVTISGGPIPEPQTATMRLKLTGEDIEGRISIPGAPEEAKVVATLDGMHISGEIQIDTGGMGYPTLEADIVEEDHMVGIISFQGFDIDLDANRTDKNAVEFKVVKRKTRGKGGRPLPPDLDEALEPLRAMLKGEIPAIIRVHRADQIAAAMKIAEEFEVSIVLRDAEGAAAHAEALKERQIGVILPQTIERWRNERRYHQGDDLSRAGVSIAFQSDAEDGARRLPFVGLHAVERGLSADAVLTAMTTGVAKMFKIDDRIGSLEVGKDGDLVIFSGHPFEPGSRVERVIINGEEVR